MAACRWRSSICAGDVSSGVYKDALLFAYEMSCEGTPLAGSRLEIETIPLVIHCSVCGEGSGRRRRS